MSDECVNPIESEHVVELQEAEHDANESQVRQQVELIESRLSAPVHVLESHSKRHIRVIESKLLTPTANLINSQWVPVHKDPEPQWTMTIKSKVFDEPLAPAPQANQKFHDVKSKLFSPTVASIRSKYEPKPREPEGSLCESARSGSGGSPDRPPSPPRPIPESLLKSTESVRNSIWVKPPTPSPPKPVEHRKKIEVQPVKHYEEVSSRLHIPTAASLHARYTPPKNPQASLLPFRPASPPGHSNPLSHGGYLTKSPGKLPPSPFRRNTIYVPHPAMSGAAGGGGSVTTTPSKAYAPTPSADVWSANSPNARRTSFYQTPISKPSQGSRSHPTSSAKKQPSDNIDSNGVVDDTSHDARRPSIPDSLMKETVSLAHSHYKKPVHEPTRQEIIFEQHGHKLHLPHGPSHLSDGEEIPVIATESALLKETVASSCGHYVKQTNGQIHAAEPVPLDPNRRPSINGEAAKARNMMGKQNQSNGSVRSSSPSVHSDTSPVTSVNGSVPPPSPPRQRSLAAALLSEVSEAEGGVAAQSAVPAAATSAEVSPSEVGSVVAVENGAISNNTAIVC